MFGKLTKTMRIIITKILDDMKNFAVITNSQRDFNVFKLENQYSGNDQNFIQVQTIEDVLKNQFNDFVVKSNSVKMPNVNAIIKAVENNINQLN